MSISREDVLRVAKECSRMDGEGCHSGMAMSYDALERFAAAIGRIEYAAGAEAMRELVCFKVKAMTATTDEWSEDFEFTEKRVATEIHDAIRALPITPTNTEGEQDE